MNEKEGGSMREGTNKKKKEKTDFSHLPEPSSETKLAMMKFMVKHALPRMIEAERKKQLESENHNRTEPGGEKGRSLPDHKRFDSKNN
jgi:hypothetical protein